MNLTIGKRIQTLRKQKGLSQQDLANQLNMSRQAVSKWELDQTLPDLETLVKMSELFETSIAYIMGVEENNKSFSELYDLMQTVLNNQQKANKNRNVIQIATIALCVISLILNLFMSHKLNTSSSTNNTPSIQNSLISTMYTYTEDRFNQIEDNLYISDDSYLDVYYFELEKMVARLDGKFYLNEYTPDTVATLTFKYKLNEWISQKEFKMNLVHEKDNLFIFDDEVPLVNYNEITLSINQGNGVIHTVSLTNAAQHNYLDHAFLGNMNLTIPTDESGKLQLNTIEFDPTLINTYRDNLYWYYFDGEVTISFYQESGSKIDEFTAPFNQKTIYTLKQKLPTDTPIYVSFEYHIFTPASLFIDDDTYISFGIINRFGYPFIASYDNVNQPKLSFVINNTDESYRISQLASNYDETTNTYFFQH